MLDIYFLTSNRAKFNHIKYLLRDYAINIKPQSDYGKAYDEPRIFDRNKLLEASIKDANTRLAKGIKYGRTENIREQTQITIDELALRHQEKLFIIEDTSIRIEALSYDDEFPGTDVKYWMRETDFKSLNKQLAEKKNNRNVTVRSDIVIYLPPSFRESNDSTYFKVFTGETTGKVVEKEFIFKTNTLHPWLDNKTFNKWFVPDGEKKPISMLPIKTANKYDFRKKAIEKLINYLQENVSTSLSQSLESRTPFQIGFFDKPNFIICGPTCAGKTILAENLSKQHGHYHIEASDFMHLAYYRKHGFNSNVSIHDFALDALKENPTIVSDQINAHLELIGHFPGIITGFRSQDELTIFQTTARKFNQIYIEANVNLRFYRNIERAREGHAKSEKKFEEQDKKQMEMGIEKIKLIPTFNSITNESSIENYFNTVNAKYFSESKRIKHLTDNISEQLKGSNLSLEESILISLFIESKANNLYFTTTEIAKLINHSLSEYRRHHDNKITTDKNNVSRYFNQKLYPYYEISVPQKTTKFRLSTTGFSHTKYILKLISVRKKKSTIINDD